MTPCEKLGYKVGDEFVLSNVCGTKAHRNGAKVRLCEDDGTDSPFFFPCEYSEEQHEWCHGLDEVEPIERQINLRKGDYCSTANMTGSEYHAVAAAFMAAGAERGDLWNSYRENCGWDVRDNTFYCIIGVGNWFTGRHLTINQVLNATNAKPTKNPQQESKPMSGKDGEKLGVKRTVTINIAGLNAKPQQESTPMTVIDTLHEAKRQRDEAAERLETAEAVLNVALDAVRADLGEGFDLNMNGAQPAEDMGDPNNWQAGDVIKAVENRIDLTEGREYVIKRLDYDGDPAVEDDTGDVEERDKDYFTFVRRP